MSNAKDNIDEEAISKLLPQLKAELKEAAEGGMYTEL